MRENGTPTVHLRGRDAYRHDRVWAAPGAVWGDRDPVMGRGYRGRHVVGLHDVRSDHASEPEVGRLLVPQVPPGVPAAEQVPDGPFHDLPPGAADGLICHHHHHHQHRCPP